MSTRLTCRRRRLAAVVFHAALLTALTAALTAQLALAQLPATRLGSVFPPGAKAGQQLELTISGADLDDVDKLLFSHAGIAAKQAMAEPGPFDKGPQPEPNKFQVTVAANVPLGVYEVRAVGKYGASNPRAFFVGDVAESTEIEPNNDADTATELTLPTVVNGQSNQNADVDLYRFQAAANQRILVTSVARRADSPMDTIVTVYDPLGRVVGSSGDDHAGDSLVDFRTAAAGEYRIKIHDSAFQGSPEHVYRLTVGALPHIDFIFPPAGQAGGARKFTIYGANLPGGKPAPLRLGNRVLEQVDVTIGLPAGAAAQNLVFNSRLSPASAALDATEYRVKGPGGSSAPTLVGIAAAPPVLEIDNNQTSEAAQPLQLPCEVMGRFYPQRDRDWYVIQAVQGEVISAQVISQRMGLPTNPSLLVQRVVKPAEGETAEQVQQLAYVHESTDTSGGPEFDVRHQDPMFRFVAPADGAYRLMVRDALADVSADPRRSYRLLVDNRPGDFRLAAVPEQSYAAALLRKGGQAGIRVIAFRRGAFAGEIKVTATGLPAGVTCTDAVIGPSSRVGMLVLTAAPNAAPATALIKVSGSAQIGGAAVTRASRYGAALAPTTVRNAPNQNINAVESRLTRDLAVSVSAAETSIVSLQAGGGKVWEASRGSRLTIPVARSGAFKGQINFVARGLPNINFPVANLGANKATGEVQVNLTAAVPPGTHTFYLDGIAQQADYARNPEAAAKAAARKKEVDALKVKTDADLKTATAAKTAADSAATAATAAKTAATTAKTAADQAAAAATANTKTTADTAAKAAAAAKAKPDDAALKAASAAATKAAADAVAAAKLAADKAAAADKALADADAKQKAAAEAKQRTDEAAAKATELAQAAAQLKTQTDALATSLANAAKPKKLNLPVVSTPVTIKIAPAPVTVTDLKPVVVKQGEKVEAAIAITRLFQFDGQVTFGMTLPPGVAGLSIPNVAVPAKQAQAKISVTAAANATVGEHEVKIRGTMNLNGQNLTVDQVMKLTVQPGAPK